jgi:hypothetical protein
MGGMRKKVILIGVIAVPIFLGIFSYQIWFATFFATKFLAGRKDGQQGIIRSITISWRSYQIHLHHWLVTLIVAGILAVKGCYILPPATFYGVASAVVFQGIYCYKDWYRIIGRSHSLPASPRPMSLAAGDDDLAAEPPILGQLLLDEAAG